MKRLIQAVTIASIALSIVVNHDNQMSKRLTIPNCGTHESQIREHQLTDSQMWYITQKLKITHYWC